MNQARRQQGFTIIEVVLVLAIAALIFLMVFLAFPALQKNQRDQQRRSDVGRAMSQLSQYQTNNKGQVPDMNASTTVANSFGKFVNEYLKSSGEQFNDPTSGDPYSFAFGIRQPASGQIVYAKGATCNGESIESSPGSRKVAIAVKLESSGYFCQSSN